MITYKPIIIPGGRRKDGTWPVKIRITFKGASRRLPTTLVCTDNDLTRSGKIKNGTILEKAGELITRMRACCSDLSPFVLENWDVDRVVSHIRARMREQSFQLDFFEWADQVLATKEVAHTRSAYVSALNALERFVGSRRLDINDITKAFLQEFTVFVTAEPPARGRPRTAPDIAASRHLLKLAHIYQQAKLRYNDEDTGAIVLPRNPFAGLEKPRPAGLAQENLGVEVIGRIAAATPRDERESISVAVFLLSFITYGANMADLWAARPFSGDVWRYNRQKVSDGSTKRGEVRCRIEPEAVPFLRVLGAGSSAEWWLPALHRWGTSDKATAMVNQYLRKFAEREGLPSFRFYAARHTFASVARSIGVEKATVDEALAHTGDFKLTDIYAERNWKLAWDANRRVLDLVDWPTKEADGPADL